MPSMIIAHHLVLTGYGHWLPNDPRGSGSAHFRHDNLADLGPIHTGRKAQQPPRPELRAFYRQATPRLEHEPIWFDEALRATIAAAFAEAAKERGYTVWACAVLRNHAHLLVRQHRDRKDAMWWAFADKSREAILDRGAIPREHRAWSERPYSVFLHTPTEVRERIGYVEDNPPKEGLAPQAWPFVVPYNNWPLHKRRPD